MALPSGLYLIFFPQYIHDEDPDNDYDDDGTCIKYSRGLGVAIYIGDVPSQSFFDYYQKLRDKFKEMYGTEKPARMELYPHGSDEPGEYSPGMVATEDELMHMLLNYKNVSPGQREMLDVALDMKKDIMQFFVRSDKQSPMPVFPPVATPAKGKKKRKKIPDTKYREAIGLVLGKSMPQSEAEAKCGLWVGALSKGKGAKLLDEATKAIADFSRLKKDDGIAEDYLYNEVRHKEDHKK